MREKPVFCPTCSTCAQSPPRTSFPCLRRGGCALRSSGTRSSRRGRTGSPEWLLGLSKKICFESGQIKGVHNFIHFRQSFYQRYVRVFFESLVECWTWLSLRVLASNADQMEVLSDLGSLGPRPAENTLRFPWRRRFGICFQYFECFHICAAPSIKYR